MILPLSEARLAVLSTVAAAIADTPWSIAWVTMWKTGPEWAAQQAKYVRAMAANCGVRSACAAVMSWPSAPAAEPEVASVVEAGGSRTSRATGMTTSHTTSPSTSMAKRQSWVVMSQRARGAMIAEPTLSPAETSATARLR